MPPSGTFNFSRVGEGATAVLVFDNRGNVSYTVDLSVVESDQTSTRVQRMVDLGMDTRETVMIIPASDDITFPSSSDQTILTVNDKDVIDLNGVSRVTTTKGALFQNNVVSLPDGSILADNVNMFVYYDGFRFYCFNESLINPLGGPGNLYINPATGTSLYSISSAFNRTLDDPFRAIVNPPTSPPSTTTTSTAPPTLSTTTESVIATGTPTAQPHLLPQNLSHPLQLRHPRQK